MTKAVNLGEDWICRGCPYERLGVLVAFVDVLAKSLLQLRDAGMASTANTLLSDFGKEPLDQIDPTGTGWGEVQVEPRTAQEPFVDVFHFVGRVVVQDDVNL